MADPFDAPFSVTIAVRSYEIDVNGHVNQAVYHQYGEYARSEQLRRAGLTIAVQRELGMGVVLLESRIRYLRELTLGDEVRVSSDLRWGTGTVFHIEHELVRADGVRAAEISCVLGLLDSAARRLLPDPRSRITDLVARRDPSGDTVG